MTRTPNPRLLAFAQRLYPGLKDLNPEAQIGGTADVITTALAAPFLVAGLIGLMAATDLALIGREWPTLLLLGGLLWAIQQLPLFFTAEVEPGRYGDFTTSLEGAVHGTAILLFGPTALWLAALLYLVDRVQNRALFTKLQWRWFTLRNDAGTLVAQIFAPLVALGLYQLWGGLIPFPGLTLGPIGLAFGLLLVRALLGGVLIAFYTVFFGYTFGVLANPQTRAAYVRFSLLALTIPWLADPFGILGAGLYVAHGLAGFLFFAVGLMLVGLLARQFSHASERSRRQARLLERLEQLSRALLAAPPDASTLPEVLKAHLPGMFPVGRIEIRLYPTLPLALYPEGIKLAPEALWSWLKEQAETRFVDAHATRPWPDEPEELVLATPILAEAAHAPLGGICLRYRRVIGLGESLGAKQFCEFTPALQSLAAQVASALHRAEVYHQTLADQKRQQELAFAGQVQASFLPASTPDLSGWQIAAGLEPARETSGDFYDFIPLPDDRLGLVVADVTDKGTGAALYMALSRTLIRTFAVEHYPDPVAALTAANLRLLADSRLEMFVTVFFGILNPVTGQLTYCNAGHNPPYIFDGATRALTHTLRRTGMPLGIMDDVRWGAGTAQLAPGDVCVLYTDGVTEAQNEAEDFWGEARLQATMLTHLGQCAAEVRAALLADLHAFVGQAPQSDDITLMVVARE